MPTLVLASASPRRRELLERAGLAFEVLAVDVDEAPPPGAPPEEAAVAIARRKADSAARLLAGGDVHVLAADTIVALGEGAATRLLGKPADEDEARAMLRALSGTRHRVVTGVCARRLRDGREECGFERTFVSMRAITEAEIEAYAASREWQGKAGGYAIQESADRFVLGLQEGGYDNVVGLPLRLARELLGRLAS